MNNVKGALTRKFGPLPAWAWFLGLFLVIYFYRKNRGAASGTGTGSVAPASGPPQAQDTLQPGESLYDPNTGALVTAPGGSGSGSDQTATDLGQAMDNLANAIATGMPAGQVNVVMPQPPGSGTTHTSGTRDKKKKHKTTKRTPKPKVKLKVKRHSNPARNKREQGHVRGGNGGRTKSVGGYWTDGGWRKGKPGGHNAAGGTLGAWRSPSHGKHPTQHNEQGPHSHGGSPAPPRAHQRPRTPAVHQVPNQRRPAVTPRPAPHPDPTPNHRPSAPPPRTHRAPAPHPPAPKTRRRK